MRVFPSPCELQLLKPRQPQLASWICSVCAVAFAFQANDGSDEESQKSPFETKVRIKASWASFSFSKFCVGKCPRLSGLHSGTNTVQPQHALSIIWTNNPGNCFFSRLLNSSQWSDQSTGNSNMLCFHLFWWQCFQGFLSMRWSMHLFVASLHILISFRIHQRHALQPAALLCNCLQGLAEQLRQNSVTRRVWLEGQEMDDEQVKAPRGADSGYRGGRGCSSERETEFSWWARCLTMPLLPEMRSQFTTTWLSTTRPLPRANSAQALADAIRVNKAVEQVFLAKNNFGNDGLKARAPRRGPLLRGGMVKGRRSRTLSFGSSVSWAIFLLQTAVRQRWCVKHDVLWAFLKATHFTRSHMAQRLFTCILWIMWDTGRRYP